MPNVTLNAARAFVLDVSLPPVDRAHMPLLLDASADPSFDAGKDQAVVVGSGVVTFAQGVPPERRLAVTNSLLLAQLVARHNVPDASNLADWYRQYTSVLANIGWLVETNSTTQTVDNSTDFDTHDAVLSIATTLLGPGAVTALKLVGATLDAGAPGARAEPTLVQLQREYGDKLRVVFKNDPLPFHPRAEPASELALEARAQKGDAAFWTVHDALFANQTHLEDADLATLATRAGLDQM